MRPISEREIVDGNMVRLAGVFPIVLLVACGRIPVGGSTDASRPADGDGAGGQPADARSMMPSPDGANDSQPRGAGDAARPFVVKAIYMGSNSSFALLTDGRLATWGENSSGQLGHAGDGNFKIVEPGFELVALSSYGHTCFLDSTGLVRCSGDNSFFQLGDGTNENRLNPTPVTVISDPARLLAVGGITTCVHTAQPAVKCWGGSTLGLNLRTEDEGIEYLDLAVGGNYHCALGVGGTVSCRGSYSVFISGVNWVGAQASAVTGVTGAVQIAAGFDHACARTTEGIVWCWGNHSGGQLGVATPPTTCTEVSCTPKPIVVEIPAGVHVSKIAAKNSATLAVTSDGRLFGWGGLELDGSCDHHPVCSWLPRQLSEFTDVIEADMGRQHLCLRRADGSVWCWGLNRYGQVSAHEDYFVDHPVQVIP